MRALMLVWIWVQLRFQLWMISGDVAYLKACAADELVDGLCLREFRREIARRECLVIALHAQARALRGGEVLA